MQSAPGFELRKASLGVVALRKLPNEILGEIFLNLSRPIGGSPGLRDDPRWIAESSVVDT